MRNDEEVPTVVGEAAAYSRPSPARCSAPRRPGTGSPFQFSSGLAAIWPACSRRRPSVSRYQGVIA